MSISVHLQDLIRQIAKIIRTEDENALVSGLKNASRHMSGHGSTTASFTIKPSNQADPLRAIVRLLYLETHPQLKTKITEEVKAEIKAVKAKLGQNDEQALKLALEICAETDQEMNSEFTISI